MTDNDPENSLLLKKQILAEALITRLNSPAPFNEYMKTHLELLLQLIPCEAGSILELNHKENVFFFRSAAGKAATMLSSITIPLGQGIVSQVLESKIPKIIHNIPENKVHLSTIANLTGFEVRNLAAAPILVQGKKYGVLELLNRTVQGDFSSTDAKLLEYYCNLMSVILEARILIENSRK